MLKGGGGQKAFWGSFSAEALALALLKMRRKRFPPFKVCVCGGGGGRRETFYPVLREGGGIFRVHRFTGSISKPVRVDHFSLRRLSYKFYTSRFEPLLVDSVYDYE